MGSCVGRCLSHSEISRQHSHNFTNDSSIEFQSLTSEISETAGRYETGRIKRSTFLQRLFARKKEQSMKSKKPVLELVEELWRPGPDSSYSRLHESVSQRLAGIDSFSHDIPLQCLDARALLAQTGGFTASPTPASSLDLEWEHETLPISVHDPSVSSWALVPTETASASETNTITQKATRSTTSDWSRVPSADSLEWDPIQSPLCPSPTSDLDTDTQLLLNEIERLTDQALRETGRDIHS